MKIPFHPDSLKMYKEYCERNFDILKIKMILKSLAQKKQAVDFTLPGKCCLPKMCQLSIVLSVIVRNRQKSFPQKYVRVELSLEIPRLCVFMNLPTF